MKPAPASGSGAALISAGSRARCPRPRSLQHASSCPTSSMSAAGTPRRSSGRSPAKKQRLIREIFRHNKIAGLDVVVVPKRELQANLTVLEADYRSLSSAVPPGRDELASFASSCGCSRHKIAFTAFRGLSRFLLSRRLRRGRDALRSGSWKGSPPGAWRVIRSAPPATILFR